MSIINKLIKTRKDLSVWIIADIWLIVNFGCWFLFGREALIFTNPIMLSLITIFVFYVKSHKNIDKWFEEKLR